MFIEVTQNEYTDKFVDTLLIRNIEILHETFLGRELDLLDAGGFSGSGSLWLSRLIFSPTDSRSVAESTTTPLSSLWVEWASFLLSAADSLLSKLSLETPFSVANNKEICIWKDRRVILRSRIEDLLLTTFIHIIM